MKILYLAAVGLIAAAAGSASAKGAVQYTIGVPSDYIVRGYTQTRGGPALQAGADYTNAMFYAGTAASTVAFTAYELDLYAGLRKSWGPLSFDTGLVAYRYADPRFNLAEAKALVEQKGLTADTVGSVGLTYALSPRWSLDGRLSGTARGTRAAGGGQRLSLSVRSTF